MALPLSGLDELSIYLALANSQVRVSVGERADARSLLAARDQRLETWKRRAAAALRTFGARPENEQREILRPKKLARNLPDI